MKKAAILMFVFIFFYLSSSLYAGEFRQTDTGEWRYFFTGESLTEEDIAKIFKVLDILNKKNKPDNSLDAALSQGQSMMDSYNEFDAQLDKALKMLNSTRKMISDFRKTLNEQKK